MRWWLWYDELLHRAGHTNVHLVHGTWTLLRYVWKGVM